MPESATADQLISTPTLEGRINEICRYHDHDGQRFILIHGAHFYVYDLGDRFSEAHVWISLHLAGYAKMSEIARGTELSARSLQRWKSAVLRDGFEALLPKPIPGRPRTVTTTVKRNALRLIHQGNSHAQVEKKLGISPSSLDRIIAEDKAANRPQTTDQMLDFKDDDEPSPPPQQPSLDQDQPAANPSPVQREKPETPKAEPIHAGPCADPLDRSVDRAMAAMGLIEDADPFFAEGDRVDCLGFFMVIALLNQNPLLEIFGKIYGKALGPAFYGLRTTVMTLLMMAMLRIKRPEHLRQYNPANLGRALGLDRIMEVKTMRRKLHTLAGKNQGINLMEELGKSRLEGRPAPQEGELNILYLDGHVQCYHGIFKIGQTWSATRNRVVKGRTDTWLHLPGQTPLFYLESPFNEGLVSVIEKHQGKIEEVFGEKPVLAFDREGWDMNFLNELDKSGWKFITYRKGSYTPLPLDDFEKVETTIGNRFYSHRPVDIEKQNYNLYETGIGKNGKPVRRLAGKTHFREVRILSDDRTHQTAIVTNLEKAEVDANSVSASLFARWGNQENVFKYMREEFDLDALVEYNRSEGQGGEQRGGEEQIPVEVDHPNPDYKKLSKKISKQRGEQTKLLARYGITLEKEILRSEDDQEIGPEVLAKVIDEIRSSKDSEKLKQLNSEIARLRIERAALEQRTGVASAGYKQLRRGIKQITDSIKMAAYELENELYGMLGKYYANRDKEGRKLIAAALRSSGRLKLKGGKIIVRLEAQASPNRTAAIDAMCTELNKRQAKFPGTDLQIEFDITRST